VATVEDVIHAIWDEIKNDPNSEGYAAAGVSIAVDTLDAVSLDGAAPTGATPTGAGDWLDGSYLVIQGPHAAGGAWQCQIAKDAGDDLGYRFAFRGGWLNATEFTLATTSVNLTKIVWNDSLDPGAGSTLELLATNVATWGVAPGPTGQALTAFMARLVLPTGVTDSGILCGGFYRPTRQDGVGADPDTHPCAVVGGDPLIGSQNSSTSWGYATANANCRNRVAAENTHTTVDLSAAGYGGVRGNHSLLAAGGGATNDLNGNHMAINYLMNRVSFVGSQGEICPEILAGMDVSADVDGAVSGSYQKGEQFIFRKP
jgi:hypothetical protein